MKFRLSLVRGALAALLFLLAHRPATAQFYYGQAAVDTSLVYTRVEKMPTLRGGGGNVAIVKAVQRQLQVPAEVREGKVEGRVFVQFVVGPKGTVRQSAIARSLSPACDAAALAAVKKLPTFVPGQQGGLPVKVLFTVPVVFVSPRHVFSSEEVTQAAQFPGGTQALEKFINKTRQTPAEVAARSLRGRVVVRYVLKADGRVGSTEVLNSLCPSCDEEALRIVRLMPRWQPALGYDDKPVATYQALNIWFEPPADAPQNVPDNQVYGTVQQPPTLPNGGGTAALAAAIQEQIQYPERAIEGKMEVSFIVEPDGRVSRPAIVRSMGSDYDEAALAAVMKLPRLTPGQQGGRAVAVRMVVPLAFDIR